MVDHNRFGFKEGDRVFFEDENSRERVKATIREIQEEEARLQTSRSPHDEWIHLSQLHKVEVTITNNYHGPVTQNYHAPETKKKRKRSAHATHYRLLQNFVDYRLASLSENQIRVWIFLFRHAYDGVVSLAVRDIGNRTGLSKDAVNRTLKSLRKIGMLRVKKKGGYQRGVSTYLLLAPIPKTGE